MDVDALALRAGMRRAVFLDRDGVLNWSEVRDGRPFAPRRLEEFVLLPGVAQAVTRLRAAGYLAIVATNQKDVGAGLVEPAVVEAMHARLRAEVTLDAIWTCTCVDDCPCYKPNPGMLFEARDRFGLDLGECVMVGDRWRDVGAGFNAGCWTVFIDRGYREALHHRPHLVAADLPEAVELILDGALDLLRRQSFDRSAPKATHTR